MTRAKAPALPPKEPAPEALNNSVDAARARTRSRRHGPVVQYQRDEQGELVRDDAGHLIWDWPFTDEGPDGKPWSWLILDAFGTRNPVVATVFINTLLDLVGSTWDNEAQHWVPDDHELQALLHVIAAHRPKNEAQAAMAAERAVTMLLTLKVGKQVARYPHDTRTVAAYAKLAIAGAAQTKALADMQGNRKASVQKITVKRENHVHYTYSPGGSGKSAHQPHESSEASENADRADPTGERPSLRCPESGGQVVLLPGVEGPDGVPTAWGQGRRAKG